MAELRLLERGDLRALCMLQACCFAHPWSEVLLESRFELPESHNLGLFDGEDLLGYTLFSQQFDEAELLQIAVAPERRRGGLGRRLLGESLERLASCGVTRVMLEVRVSNQAAIRLYRALGFTDDGVRPGYYPTETGREDALLMSCHIRTSD